MADALVALDLRQWTTDQVGRAYVEALRRPQGSQDPERAALQAEWSRRPTPERLAALRRFRDEVPGPRGRAAVQLAEWATDIRA